MLIDSHAHLDSSQFDADREHVVRRALEAEVDVISIATDLRSSQKSLEITRKYELHCTAGLHPHEAAQFDAETLNRLREFFVEPEVVAVGEIGLDYFKEYAPREIQQKALKAQLALALELNKPVVIHLRDAADDLLAILRTYNPHPQSLSLEGRGKPEGQGEGRHLRGVIHSFTGDWTLAEELLALEFSLSVNGIVTFERSGALRATVGKIPLDRLLIETDSPYLAPVPMRGRRNEPSLVRYVAQTVAQVKRLAFEEVARVTTRNARELFGF